MKHSGLDYLHRVYWRLYDLPGWGEANWHAREDVAARIIEMVNKIHQNPHQDARKGA